MARNLFLIAGAAALTLSACGPPPARPPEAPVEPAMPAEPQPAAASSAPTYVYVCANGDIVRASYPDAETAIVDYQGRTRTMKTAAVASGARYVGDGLQWWTKGLNQGAVAPLGVGETIAGGPAVTCEVKGQGASSDAGPTPPAAQPPLTPPAPGEPGGLPDDRTPVSEAPFTPQSAQGAANVVASYYALLSAGKYGEAWKLWGDGGKASGAATPAAFSAQFDAYSEYHANIGAPGEMEGAAGSSYVTVPVQVYARLKTGGAVYQLGAATLRRVNDVPGSTAEQRAWRLQKIDLKATPPGKAAR